MANTPVRASAVQVQPPRVTFCTVGHSDLELSAAHDSGVAEGFSLVGLLLLAFILIYSGVRGLWNDLTTAIVKRYV